LLCLLGYFIPVNLLAARTTLLTAATIAAVGNKYVVNTLTETSVSASLVNVAVISAFAMVLTYMLASVRCERIAEAGDRRRADRRCRCRVRARMHGLRDRRHSTARTCARAAHADRPGTAALRHRLRSGRYAARHVPAIANRSRARGQRNSGRYRAVSELKE